MARIFLTRRRASWTASSLCGSPPCAARNGDLELSRARCAESRLATEAPCFKRKATLRPPRFTGQNGRRASIRPAPIASSDRPPSRAHQSVNCAQKGTRRQNPGGKEQRERVKPLDAARAATDELAPAESPRQMPSGHHGQADRRQNAERTADERRHQKRPRAGVVSPKHHAAVHEPEQEQDTCTSVFHSCSK